MIFRILLTAFIFFHISNIVAQEKTAIDFYAAFASEHIGQMNVVLEQLDDEFVNQKAYKGALIMKKAGLMDARPLEKARMFNDGRDLLETAIQQHPENTEFRFLRLAVQENAPNIMKYNAEIQEDKAAVIADFPKVPTYVQREVINYARTSDILKEEDLVKK